MSRYIADINQYTNLSANRIADSIRGFFSDVSALLSLKREDDGRRKPGKTLLPGQLTARTEIICHPMFSDCETCGSGVGRLGQNILDIVPEHPGDDGAATAQNSPSAPASSGTSSGYRSVNSTPASTSQTSSPVASNRQLSPARLGYSTASTTRTARPTHASSATSAQKVPVASSAYSPPSSHRDTTAECGPTKKVTRRHPAGATTQAASTFVACENA